MERLSKYTLILFFFLPLGCGVKGRPLSPLNPAPIGRGEPTFKEDEARKALKKRSQKRDDNQSPTVEE